MSKVIWSSIGRSGDGFLGVQRRMFRNLQIHFTSQIRLGSTIGQQNFDVIWSSIDRSGDGIFWAFNVEFLEIREFVLIRTRRAG